MSGLPENIKAIKDKYGLEAADFWKQKQSGKWIVRHAALERVASQAGIRFERPAMIASDAEKKIAVVCVEGHLGERSEWSFGEAAVYNNQNSYPYAMAEKRAKDRVVLKLLNLSGDAYSEDEADEFRDSAPERQQRPASGKPLSVQTDARDRLDWSDVLGDRPLDIVTRNASQSREPFKALQSEMRQTATVQDLTEWADTKAPVIWSLSDEARHHLREAYENHLANIETEMAAA